MATDDVFEELKRLLANGEAEDIPPNVYRKLQMLTFVAFRDMICTIEDKIDEHTQEYTALKVRVGELETNDNILKKTLEEVKAMSIWFQYKKFLKTNAKLAWSLTAIFATYLVSVLLHTWNDFLGLLTGIWTWVEAILL